MSDDERWEHSHFHERSFGLFRSLRRALVASIAAVTAWISGTLLYFAFWASHFTVFQDVVVVIVSLLVLMAVLVSSWISFGLRFADH